MLFRKSLESLKLTNYPLKQLACDPATPIEMSPNKDSKAPRQVFNSHLSLVAPTIPARPLELISYNIRFFSRELGLEGALARDSITSIFSGNEPFPASNSWSYCYGGHQFGHWAGQLGDGRAISIAQVDSPSGLWEFQLKGAGMTPYSRFGDGFAVVRSSIREYLAAEYMNALKVPSSRSISLINTNQDVQREEVEKGAIVCRVAPTWIRFGSFEIFYARQDINSLRVLADYTIKHHFKEISLDCSSKYLDWLKAVIKSTAVMVAKWQSVGFCHGVCNTDNFSVLGITIDYGPFQFLDAYISDYVCNHSDSQGMYSFEQQPIIAFSNLVRFTSSISPLLNDEFLKANEDGTVSDYVKGALDEFLVIYHDTYNKEMSEKLGFIIPSKSIVENIIRPLIELMQDASLDYSLFFRIISDTSLESDELCAEDYARWISCSYLDKEAFEAARNSAEETLKSRVENFYLDFKKEHQRLDVNEEARMKLMTSKNPKYFLRNSLLQKVISIVEGKQDGWETVVDRWLQVLQDPFRDHILTNQEKELFVGGITSNGLVSISDRRLKCSCSS